MRVLRVSIAILGLALWGCAATPAVLRGDRFSPISPSQAVVEQHTGELVRWGGEIVGRAHDASRTCFDVVGQPLDDRARPLQAADVVTGRFRACAPGFYDPAVYGDGRAITTVGVVEDEATIEVDGFELRVPVVAADVVYLWPRAREYTYVPYAYPPYGYGWPGYGWGPYFGPSFGFGFAAPVYPYRPYHFRGPWGGYRGGWRR
jgi:outer membrane lipoprotein